MLIPLLVEVHVDDLLLSIVTDFYWISYQIFTYLILNPYNSIETLNVNCFIQCWIILEYPNLCTELVPVLHGIGNGINSRVNSCTRLDLGLREIVDVIIRLELQETYGRLSAYRWIYVEYGRLGVVVESCETISEYADSTPTLRVSGISVGFGRFVPAATVSGISWENGGLDSVVESWEIISVFISWVGMFTGMGFPAPLSVGEIGGGLVWTPRLGVPQIPSAGSWERLRYAIAVESYTPTQGDGRGLPRPRQIPSPPGGPWMNKNLNRP